MRNQTGGLRFIDVDHMNLGVPGHLLRRQHERRRPDLSSDLRRHLRQRDLCEVVYDEDAAKGVSRLMQVRAGHALEVVGQAYQLPFAAHFGLSSQQ